MEEEARNQMWEDMNAPDPYELVLRRAAKELEKAISLLDSSIDRLYDAESDLSETPMQSKVESFIDEVTGIKSDLMKIRESWERGERE
jgi:division protein CdvB (Snf7/Vps24/ESCRT-III family)